MVALQIQGGQVTLFTQFMILSKSAEKRMEARDPESYRILKASFLRQIHGHIDELSDEMKLRRLQEKGEGTRRDRRRAEHTRHGDPDGE